LKITKLLIICVVFIIGCATTITAPNSQSLSNLNGYKYLVVESLEYSNAAADQYGVRQNIINTIMDNSTIKVLARSQISQVPTHESHLILYATISHETGFTCSTTMRFFDFSGTQIITIKGGSAWGGQAWRLGLNDSSKNAAKKFCFQYTGFKPELAINPGAKFASWPKINFPVSNFRKILSIAPDLSDLEGEWTLLGEPRYTIGIFRDSNSGSKDFNGFIIESASPTWSEGQLKLEFSQSAIPGVYTGVYFMGDHKKEYITATMKQPGFLSIQFDNPQANKGLEALKKFPMLNSNADSENIQEKKGAKVGTGFLLDPSGYIATNYHVVNEATTISAKFSDIGESLRCEVILKDINNDLAILKTVDDLNTTKRSLPYYISDDPKTRIGDRVHTVGYPLSSILGNNPKYSDGTVTSLFGIEGDPRLMQISNPIQPGNSGGILFDDHQVVVGVVVSTLNVEYLYKTSGAIPQNVNFAIKSTYLSSLIQMLPKKLQISKPPMKKNEVLLPDLIGEIEQCTVLIVAN